jgi:hypothetical protein
MNTEPSASTEVTLARLAMYTVGEIWPRFVRQFGKDDLAAFTDLQNLALWFASPKDANERLRNWLMEFMTGSPDVAAWSLNELRKESNALLSLEINEPGQGKNEVGALKLLVLIGIDGWGKNSEFTHAGAIEKAAAAILGESDQRLTRKFENAKRKVETREKLHRETYAKLIAASLPYPRYRSVGQTFPQIAEKFPDVVPLLDRAATDTFVLPEIRSGLALGDVIERFVKQLSAASKADASGSQDPGTQRR